MSKKRTSYLRGFPERLRETIFSVILGLIIAGILFAVFHPIAERERAQRREKEKQIVAELRAKDRAYELEVAAEKARMDETETGYKDATTYIVNNDDRMNPEDIACEKYWDSLELLAAVVEAEAGNQDLTGKKLVVDTVLNRVADPDFPDTIEGVIYQKNQYSVVWNGQMRKYLEGREAITDDCFTAVNEELIDQVDYAAIYFNAGGWPEYGTRLYKYGDHYFASR